MGRGLRSFLAQAVGVLPSIRRVPGEEDMSVKKIMCNGRAAAAAAAAAITAACGLPGLSSPAAGLQTGAPVTVTENAQLSVLVAVEDSVAAGQAVARLVRATARPREDVDIFAAGLRPQILLESGSPAPARVTVAGKPAAPSAGATTYLRAEYRRVLDAWHSKIRAAENEVATRTRVATSVWARRFRVLPEIRGSRSAPADRRSEDPGSHANECKLAAAALASLGQETGNRFGARRVVLLYVPNLGGIPHVAELAGDDVIVVTGYLPSAARGSTGQAKLLSAGAARATILGPKATDAQIAQLVTAGLSQRVRAETLSSSVLFASGTTLLPGATHVLTPLLASLRRPGALGVINGYAYALGSGRRDYEFSLAQAAAVARFLEAHGVPASSLVVVGHGASHLASSGASRVDRVLVAIVEP
jgi:outer membrane protein OmpA-like peptidoglycan-associated protein